MRRPKKSPFGDVREIGVRGVLVYCADYRCGHSRRTQGDVADPNIRAITVRVIPRVKHHQERVETVRAELSWITGAWMAATEVLDKLAPEKLPKVEHSDHWGVPF
jgi:hypothetical protein